MQRLRDLPDDPALPQLARITDPEGMRRRLEGEFARTRSWSLERVEVRRFDYEPGIGCDVCYALQLQDVRDGVQLVSGRAAAHGSMAGSEAPHHLADLGLSLWVFPEDPQLRGLPELVDPEALVPLLAGWAGAGLRGARAETRIVKYVPGRRCVLEHRLRRPESDRLALHSFSKTYGRGAGAAVAARMRAAWESPARRRGELSMPEPLHYDTGRDTLFLRAVPGRPADAVLAEQAIAPLAAAAARLLAALHTAELPDLPRWSCEADLLRIGRAEQGLARSDASLHPRAQALGAALRGGAPSVSVRAPIHGAFRLGQLLVAPGRLSLLDFDDITSGDPLADVGSWIGHLHYLEAKRKLSASERTAGIEGFLETYAARVPWALAPGRLRWHAAAQLLGKHVRRCVERGKPDRRGRVERLLDRAEALLAGAGELS